MIWLFRGALLAAAAFAIWTGVARLHALTIEDAVRSGLLGDDQAGYAAEHYAGDLARLASAARLAGDEAGARSAELSLVELNVAAGAAGEDARRAALVAALAAAPTRSGDWLDLASLGYSEGDPIAPRALAMAQLTAPRETGDVFDRAVFGLRAWSGLDAEARTATARDTAIILEYGPGWRVRALRLFFQRMSQADRDALRAAVRAMSGSASDRLGPG
jgi:hypothetical protein